MERVYDVDRVFLPVVKGVKKAGEERFLPRFLRGSPGKDYFES